MSNNDLLSEENKKRCLEDFKNLMPLRSSKSTKSSAAVLIPIIPSKDNVGLLYTKRSPHLRKHAREVCFPGGKVDEGETPTEAALRESFEELGLHPEQIDVWATMPALSNHTGSTSVVPVIGLINNYDAKNLVPNSEEVCDFFTKGVYDLHNPKVAGYTQFRIPDRPGYSLPVYNCQPYPIWGMTAIITYQFLSVFLKGRTQGFRHKLSFQTPLNFASKSKKN